ncbi:rhodanese-like domain-containing protein [Methylomagnum sp.]
MKKITLTLVLLMSSLVACARDVVNLTPDQLQAMQAQGALVVDVRTPEEWDKGGLIPGSKGLTYFDANGGYDKDAWLKRLKPLLASPEQPVILVCRSGHRSATVGKMLVDEAGYPKVYQLENGIKGWSSQSKPLQRREDCRAC